VGVLGEGQSIGVRGASSVVGVEGVAATGPGVSGSGAPGVFGRGNRRGATGATNGVLGVVEGTDGSGVFGGHRTSGRTPLGSASFEPTAEPGAGVCGVSIDDGHGVIGESKFGHGVVGRAKGGVDLKSHGVFATSEQTAGVVGISGPLPDFKHTAPPIHSGVYGFCEQGRGVFGGSQTDAGVFGTSLNGTGVVGASEQGRGAVFRSGTQNGPLIPQLRLVPHTLAVPAAVPAQPLMFVPGQTLLAALPRAGLAGDLLATVDPAGSCTLWFCVQQQVGANAAQWSQVLLGVPLPGGG
jgi:hypothetical protein